MNIAELKEKYKKIIDSGAKLEEYLKFEQDLISKDDDDFLDFHFYTIGNRQKENLYRYLKACFKNRKDKTKVSIYLNNKYSAGIKDNTLRGDVIQILGNLRSPFAKEIAHKEIKSLIRDIRYRCIIVLGWTGSNIDDLEILNERMLNDEDGQLRGYAATAMRQIWYNKKSVNNRITKYIKAAIPKETDDEALTGMIITIQDLHKKKLGIKESQYGDISGDVPEAKIKTLKMLDKLK